MNSTEAQRNDAPKNAGRRAPAEAERFTYASGSQPLDGYTIRRGIGHGGFGEVYYATSDAGKEVALKFIRRNLDVELRGVQQCLNLKHPNLLALYDVRTDAQGQSWVVMEYVAGESLEAALAKHSDGMPVNEALDWFRGLAAAVGYLHDQGLVHRDLKPGNVFRDLPAGGAGAKGTVKLGDYGLSKFISVSRRSGHTESIGTVHYMAPEIASGRYGKEIDIYALGVLLYEVLTGHVPFEGESVGEVLMKHLTAEPQLNRVSEPYRSLIAACLAKDPKRRPQSVAELLRRLPGAEAPTDTGPAPSSTTSTAPTAWPQPTDKLGYQLLSVWRALPVWGRVLVVVAALIFVRSVRAQAGVPVAWGGIFVGVMVIAGILMLRAAQQTWRMRAAMHLPRQGCCKPRRKQVAVEFGRRGTYQPAAAAPRRPEPIAVSAILHRSSAPARVRTVRERLADLTGSMLLGFFACLATTVVVGVLHGTMPAAELAAWLLLTSVCGTWLVLIMAALWDNRRGDALVRRFVMLVVGLAWGAAAWGFDRLLWVSLPYEMLFDHPHDPMNLHLYGVDGQPELLTYMAYFGCLMFLVRWWLQASATRSSRVSLWSLGASVVGAGVINVFWPFPQPWGLAVAGVTSFSVQLASPCRDRKARSAPAEV